MQEERFEPGLPRNLQLQVEAIARRLGCETGEWTLEFKLRDGNLAQTRRHHGPIRNEELAVISTPND